MPVEIREVVIKAQLEKSWSSTPRGPQLSKEMISKLKEEIILEILEKVEDKLERRVER